MPSGAEGGGYAARVADPDLTDPNRAITTTARLRRRRLVAGAAVGAVLVLGAGCSSGGSDEVVSAGPGGTADVETPVIDPAPSTVTSTVASSQPPVTSTDPDTGATTSTTPGPTSTSATSVPPAVTVPGGLTDPTLTMALFWVRYPDDDRVLDLPGYRDPESGPKPLVVYGSATNDTPNPVTAPQATVVWRDAAGQPVVLYATPVVLPGSTTPAPVLQPGETGDVILVIADPVGVAWEDLVPELQGGAE